MSEVTRLTTRLKSLGMKDFHVSWTAEGQGMSAEKKAWHMNRMLDEIQAGNFTSLDPADFDRTLRPFAPLQNKIGIAEIEAISR